MPDASCYVLGIFDYWPTFYEDYKDAEVTDFMVVMNLNYLLTVDDAVTYDLWFKKTDGASSDAIYRQWEQAGLMENVAEISDRQSVLNAEKSDSLVMGLNGLFSMGFVATMIISFMGFLLYWLLSVRKRRLQQIQAFSDVALGTSDDFRCFCGSGNFDWIPDVLFVSPGIEKDF